MVSRKKNQWEQGQMSALAHESSQRVRPLIDPEITRTVQVVTVRGRPHSFPVPSVSVDRRHLSVRSRP